jgi:hypothetical protein
VTHINNHTPTPSQDETCAQSLHRILTDPRKLFAPNPRQNPATEHAEDGEASLYSRTMQIKCTALLLMESLSRVTAKRLHQRSKTKGKRLEQLEAINMISQGGGHASQSTAGHAINIAREREVVSTLFGGIVYHNNEKYASERTTFVKEKLVSATQREIPVESLSDLQITERSLFPIMVKIGEEVMSITGVGSAGDVLLVRRDRNKAKEHSCGYMITCTVRLSGEPTPYAVRVNLAGKLQMRSEAITADPVAAYTHTGDNKRSKKAGEVDFEICVCVDASFLEQAEGVKKKMLEDVFPQWIAAACSGDKEKSTTFAMVSLMRMYVCVHVYVDGGCV